eukprot:CAMPEP_0170135366 /NCGR_PEP_ID=MMETSP0033_2-20121228/2441_1 /TAXON_ID=195969 /ORGANISM="Dolichomastix tenuilepis, Strain CCMP3274" /LENGTH=428 /DNA_ID=CAMNT_0010370965 /DNA_START=45 /DNA_END=1328 /DNA_ORIENTATION=+
MGSASSRVERSTQLRRRASLKTTSAETEELPSAERRPKELSTEGDADIESSAWEQSTSLVWSLQLFVSPGFDTEGGTDVPKECQDAAVVTQDPSGARVFAVVCDGHGSQGKAAAELAAESLAERVFRGGALPAAKISSRAVSLACSALQTEVMGAVTSEYSGTTAVFAQLDPSGDVFLANIGDSRAVLARAASTGEGGEGEVLEAVPVTREHKPEDVEERRRIEAEGGVIAQQQYEDSERDGPLRVFVQGGDVHRGRGPGLAMTRSLGDALAHTVGVSCEPEAHRLKISARDRFLIIASDGLWEVCSPRDAVKWLHKFHAKYGTWTPDRRPTAAKALAMYAQKRWKQRFGEGILVDDTSVILISWETVEKRRTSIELVRQRRRSSVAKVLHAAEMAFARVVPGADAVGAAVAGFSPALLWATGAALVA